MKYLTTAISAISAILAVAATTASAETYIRNGDQEIDVHLVSDALYCTRKSDGYEMCNGMTKQADGTYTGKKMKHPDMPGFMKFNGTVTYSSAGLTIQGCTLGMCQSEDWPKK